MDGVSMSPYGPHGGCYKTADRSVLTLLPFFFFLTTFSPTSFYPPPPQIDGSYFVRPSTCGRLPAA
jgi:hypothetical protein